jgi:hypothetical protein
LAEVPKLDPLHRVVASRRHVTNDPSINFMDLQAKSKANNTQQLEPAASSTERNIFSIPFFSG